MLNNLLNFLFSKNKEKEKELTIQAQQKAKEIILHANEESLRIKQEAEQESRKILSESLEAEKRLAKKEEQLDEEKKTFSTKKLQVERDKQSVDDVKKDLEEKRDTILQKLEKIAQLTKDQARNLLLAGWEDKLKTDIAKRIKQSEEDIKLQIDEKSKQMLVDAMRYGATDYVSEYTLSVVHIPSDEYKGRIIGKEGRNIRAFELATGVDVDLEEERVIKLSSFDSVKREIARVALEKLIKDGRIQPPRIEEIVLKTKEEIQKRVLSNRSPHGNIYWGVGRQTLRETPGSLKRGSTTHE